MKKEILSKLGIMILCSLGVSLIIEKFIYPEEPIEWFRYITNFGISFICIILFYLISKIIYKKDIDSKLIKRFDNLSINKIFTFLAIIFGVTFSILFPLGQIPDEITHINMIYEDRNLDIEFSDIDDNYTGYKNLNKKNKKIDTSNYFDLSKRIDTDLKLTIPNLKIIRHFPQYIGTLIGETLSLPMFIYLTLCELLALSFYIVICNIALKKMPFKKNLMMLIMLLPICIQQMASFSYDVVLNSFSFLFIAYILNLKFIKDKIKFSDIIKLIIFLLIIAICKLPYIILGLLIFILPANKFEFKLKSKVITYEYIKEKIKKHKYIYLTILVIALVFACIVAYKILAKIYIGKILLASIFNIIDTLSLFKRSIDMFLTYYLETIVGNLGIFNVDTSLIFEVFVYISLLLVTFFNFKIVKGKLKANKINFTKKDIIIIYITVILLIYIIILSMFEWTLYCTKIPGYKTFNISEIGDYITKLPYIGGVQGRYFIPVLPLILLPLNSVKITNKLVKINPIVYQIIYYIIVFVYLVIILLNRYWI